MLAKKYRSVIKSITNSFPGVYTLEFESLDRAFKFHPGQFLHIAIDSDYDGSGQWPESRCFSMQSNPEDKTIKITYAVKGKFTKEMETSLKVGSEIWLKLPYGDLFDQVHNKEKTVFIAGGTGITPFLSLFTHSSFANYTQSVIYAGFKKPELNLYKEEIEKAAQINPSLTVHFVYENVDGILNIEKIFNENGIGASYFISGPPLMIRIFKQKLIDFGVSSNNVLTDDWE